MPAFSCASHLEHVGSGERVAEQEEQQFSLSSIGEEMHNSPSQFRATAAAYLKVRKLHHVHIDRSTFGLSLEQHSANDKKVSKDVQYFWFGSLRRFENYCSSPLRAFPCCCFLFTVSEGRRCDVYSLLLSLAPLQKGGNPSTGDVGERRTAEREGRTMYERLDT